MKKAFLKLLSLSVILLIASCTLSFEKSNVNLNEGVPMVSLSTVEVINVSVDNIHVFQGKPLSGKITIRNRNNSILPDSKLQMELSMPGELHQIWKAGINIPRLNPNETYTTDFRVFHDDIAKFIAKDEMQNFYVDAYTLNATQRRTIHEVELVIRARSSEYRSLFMLYDIG